MSLISYTTSLLTIRPKISRQGDELIIRNGLLIRFLKLFMYLRKVRINMSARTVIIKQRWIWFFYSSKTLSFEEVSHIDYNYDSTSTMFSTGLFGSILQETDRLDHFGLTLVTHSGERFDIAKFHGDGSATIGDWWISKRVVDFEGTQESESRAFVNALSVQMSIPIGKQYDTDELTDPCPNCGLETPINQPKCIYCGVDTAH